MIGPPLPGRIAITGATGCLATLLRPRFCSNGVTVDTFSRTSGVHRPLESLFAPGTLESYEVLLHLAWSTVPFTAEQRSNGGADEDLELLGRLLDRLESARAIRPTHLVFFSSGGTVYGNAQDQRPHAESDPCRPIGRHGAVKLAAERAIESRCERAGLGYTILRISNPYGFPVPAERSQGIVPVALRAAAEGRPLSIWGDGTARKDFLHSVDLTDALDAILRTRPQGVYNLSYGSSHSIREVISLVESVVGRTLALNHKPAPEWDVHDSLLDNRKLAGAIGWTPSIDLPEGIAMTARSLGLVR